MLAYSVSLTNPYINSEWLRPWLLLWLHLLTLENPSAVISGFIRWAFPRRALHNDCAYKVIEEHQAEVIYLANI